MSTEIPRKIEISRPEERPIDYDKEFNSYVETFNKSQSNELPKWGNQTQFEVAMDDLKNLADGNWSIESRLEPGSKLSETAEYYHEGWRKEDFSSLYKDLLDKLLKNE